VREQTLKSVLVIINKLSDRVINGELLKYLAKTANDEQPGIRTNTTICLGKIAKNLGSSSRAKVLIAAFGRSLRDPFVHARNASLMALAATGDYFTDEDCAARIMPAICPALIDKEKVIREQAVKTMDVYMQRIRKAASSMPETALPPQNATEGTGARMGTPQPNEASSWTGWAISSFTNKLSAAAGEIQASASNGTNTPVTRVTSPGASATRLTPSTSSASTLHRQAVTSPPPTVSRASSTSNADAYFNDAPEPSYDEVDAWGEMGDMDEGDAWGEEADDNGAAAAFSKPAAKKEPTVASTPFDDGSEPDFAGWLAAQAQKKSGAGGKPLPKGLTKSTASAASKKPLAASKPKPKPVVAKKIDLKPKETGDDDGWGDGW
jgi:SCY1-like protein 1